MKTIKVKIKGTSPLLMNKYNISQELERTKGRSTTKKYDVNEDAQKSAYWGSGKKKELIIPSEVVYATMLNASSFYKIGKRSAKPMLAGNIRILPLEISLETNKYEVDVRPVVISRAKVLKGRAKLTEWEATFKIVYNEEYIPNIEVIRNILSDAGFRVGLLDFRPQRGGPFGCFEIVEFKEE